MLFNRVQNEMFNCRHIRPLNKKHKKSTIDCRFFLKYILHLQWKKAMRGALAHLARAFDWQSKGDEFVSRMLHFYNQAVTIIS